MATGQVILMLAEQGAVFSDGSIEYIKLNGQSVSRADHEVLSAVELRCQVIYPLATR
jgi:hypothetical protein